MKTLENLIGDSTYMVTDSNANRFNFFGLIEVTPELVQKAKNVVEWDFTECVTRDIHRALEVMAENSVSLNDFTGVVTFDTAEETYYLLTW